MEKIISKITGAQRRSALLACFLLFPSSLCLTAWGQSYSINWYKIAGGGGTSAAGVYSVNGTIGQPDAGGAMAGGGYSLTSGFWSLISTVQTPGAPLLSIAAYGTNVIISWPYPSTGYYLEVTTNLNTAATNWTIPNYNIISNDSCNTVVFPTVPTNVLMFRLKK
jgi:hypothetical protein